MLGNSIVECTMWAHTASCSLYLALLRPPSAGMFTEINSLTWKHTTPRPVLQMWQTYLWRLFWKAGESQTPGPCSIISMWKEKWRCNTNRRMRRNLWRKKILINWLLSLNPNSGYIWLWWMKMSLEPLLYSTTVPDTGNTALNKM